MSWGDVYCKTHWGNGVDDNDISWGKIYKALCEKVVGVLSSSIRITVDTILTFASNFFQK